MQTPSALFCMGECFTKYALHQDRRQGDPVVGAGGVIVHRQQTGCGMARKASGDLFGRMPDKSLRVDRDRAAFHAADAYRHVLKPAVGA